MQVEIEAAALLVRCNAHAAQTLLSLVAAIIHYRRFCGYRQSRPQVRTRAAVCQSVCQPGSQPVSQPRCTSLPGCPRLTSPPGASPRSAAGQGNHRGGKILEAAFLPELTVCESSLRPLRQRRRPGSASPSSHQFQGARFLLLTGRFVASNRSVRRRHLSCGGSTRGAL